MSNECVKMADCELLECPKLISRKICVIAKVCTALCTMLQKFSKCEVKASWCVNFTISLKFYVKSIFGELKRSKCDFLQF